jgi:hypothetical protein
MTENHVRAMRKLARKIAHEDLYGLEGINWGPALTD